MRALRRDLDARADRFPDDVLELQAYLSDRTRVPGVEATPGKGTRVPLYILGSSLFGARLAATFGLPYAFASHFAPAALDDAVEIYRREFRPSLQLDAPYVIAGINVLVAESRAEAEEQYTRVQRARAGILLAPGKKLSDEEADALLASPAGQALEQMATHTALGTRDEVAEQIARFAEHCGADELMTVHPSPTIEGRLRSIEILASAVL